MSTTSSIFKNRIRKNNTKKKQQKEATLNFVMKCRKNVENLGQVLKMELRSMVPSEFDFGWK